MRVEFGCFFFCSVASCRHLRHFFPYGYCYIDTFRFNIENCDFFTVVTRFWSLTHKKKQPARRDEERKSAWQCSPRVMIRCYVNSLNPCFEWKELSDLLWRIPQRHYMGIQLHCQLHKKRYREARWDVDREKVNGSIFDQWARWKRVMAQLCACCCLFRDAITSQSPDGLHSISALTGISNNFGAELQPGGMELNFAM